MRKQCRSCRYAAPGHAHFCPRCGRVIPSYTRAAFDRTRSRAAGPFVVALLAFIAGLSITAAGWTSWGDAARAPHHLAAIIVGVLVAALGFSAAAASLVASLSASGGASGGGASGGGSRTTGL